MGKLTVYTGRWAGRSHFAVRGNRLRSGGALCLIEVIRNLRTDPEMFDELLEHTPKPQSLMGYLLGYLFRLVPAFFILLILSIAAGPDTLAAFTNSLLILLFTYTIAQIPELFDYRYAKKSLDGTPIVGNVTNYLHWHLNFQFLRVLVCVINGIMALLILWVFLVYPVFDNQELETYDSCVVLAIVILFIGTLAISISIQIHENILNSELKIITNLCELRVMCHDYSN